MFEVEVYLVGKFDKMAFMAAFCEAFPRPAEIEHPRIPPEIKRARRRLTLYVPKERKEEIPDFLKRYAKENTGELKELKPFFLDLRVQLN